MIHSPLRYPGGKRKLTLFFKSVFENNNLLNGVYVEPYAGGASIALSLLFNNYVNKIIINDYDRSIYAFWHSVLYNTNKFCKLISETDITIKNWRFFKDIQKKKKTINLLSLGVSTFFLNRTNRSGILNAGVIGGINQLGNYKIDARFNKEDLIQRIKKIASKREKISLYNLDALELVKNNIKYFPKNTLIYFDPPYYNKGKELYDNHYLHKDHYKVSKFISSIKKQKWLVSYDNVDPIRKLYKKNKKITYTINYSAVNSTKGKEIMIYHENLSMPKFIISNIS